MIHAIPLISLKNSKRNHVLFQYFILANSKSFLHNYSFIKERLLATDERQRSQSLETLVISGARAGPPLSADDSLVVFFCGGERARQYIRPSDEPALSD